MNDKMHRNPWNSCLIIFVLVLGLTNVHCCLQEPENGVSPQRFMFEALPSVNVSLGDKLELRCTVENSSNLKSMNLFTRQPHANFKPTCNVSSVGGACSYFIMNVKLWDIAKYDCMKIYQDRSCFTKSLEIRNAVVDPTQLTTSTAKNHTMEPTTMKTQTTTSDIIKEMTRDPALSTTILVSENPTGGTISLTSQTVRLVTLALFVAVASFDRQLV